MGLGSSWACTTIPGPVHGSVWRVRRRKLSARRGCQWSYYSGLRLDCPVHFFRFVQYKKDVNNHVNLKKPSSSCLLLRKTILLFGLQVENGSDCFLENLNFLEETKISLNKNQNENQNEKSNRLMQAQPPILMIRLNCDENRRSNSNHYKNEGARNQ